MKARKWSELKRRMPPESRARVDARVAATRGKYNRSRADHVTGAHISPCKCAQSNMETPD
jgi:hypothetical protein